MVICSEKKSNEKKIVSVRRRRGEGAHPGKEMSPFNHI